MGVPPPGANCIPWSTKRFVSPTHTSNDFQSDIDWPLLAAAGVSSRDPLVKGDLTHVSLGKLPESTPADRSKLSAVTSFLSRP